jgi:hypothetical protein
MAKKKKKKSHHKRRRVGAATHMSNIAMKAGGIVAGAVAASFVNSAVKKSLATAPAFTGGAVAIAAGIALPMFVKNPFMEYVGDGLIAAGGLFVLNETVLSVPGISGLPVMPLPNGQSGFVRRTVAGAPMRRRVNGTTTLRTVGALYDN